MLLPSFMLSSGELNPLKLEYERFQDNKIQTDTYPKNNIFRLEIVGCAVIVYSYLALHAPNELEARINIDKVKIHVTLLRHYRDDPSLCECEKIALENALEMVKTELVALTYVFDFIEPESTENKDVGGYEPAIKEEIYIRAESSVKVEIGADRLESAVRVESDVGGLESEIKKESD